MPVLSTELRDFACLELVSIIITGHYGIGGQLLTL